MNMPSQQPPTHARECLAEVIGTFILVFFGCGSVCVAVLTGGLVGLWQVGIVWGLAIALAIYAVGAISGAHLNPAVTTAMAALRGMPAWKAPGYIASQMLGAFVAAVVLYALFSTAIVRFEADNGITRGQPGSEASAMIFTEYFPNPAMADRVHWSSAQPALTGGVEQAQPAFAMWQAMLAEALGTGALVFMIFALTDPRNAGRPSASLAGPFIGLTVTMIICVIAPLTQAGLNPARDFGPRLFCWLAGWGDVAIPGPRAGFLTVYVLSPLVGGLFGGGFYEAAFGRRQTPAPLEATPPSAPIE